MSGSTFANISSRSPVVREHPLNRGRLSWWLPIPGRMGGTTLQDLAGGNHAAIFGSPLWVRGFAAFDAALHLSPDLATPKFATAACPSLSSYTLACRVTFNDLRYATGSSNHNSLAKNWGHSSGLGYFHWGMVSANESATPGQIRCYVNASGGVSSATTSAALSAGVAYHLAVTVGNGSICLYINGQPDGTGSYTGTLSSNCSKVAFGCKLLDDQSNLDDYPVSESFLSGRLGDFSLWNRALPDAEVAQLFDQAGRGYPDLLRRGPSLICASGSTGFRPAWLGSGATLGVGIC